MTKIRIVGVPEHFNLAWHLCIKEKLFADAGIDLIWQDVPEGTGKMCQMLRDNETDIAIILTEGIMKDIQNGNPSKIIQKYVESPLIWGVHVAGNSTFKNPNDIHEKSFAISRMGSGSHLMSFVYANNMSWKKEDLSFKIVNNIQGATTSLNTGETNFFMWEKFMTKPLVDSRQLQRIDECPTPWPCFSIAVNTVFLNHNHLKINKLIYIINTKTLSFKKINAIETIIASTYNLNVEDVSLWLKDTVWSQVNFNEEEFYSIQKQLLKYGVISEMASFNDIIAHV